MWARCLWGVSGLNCSTGTPTYVSWTDALEAPRWANEAAYLTFNNWRLPNIKELATLINYQCTAPAINLTLFPNMDAVQVWSSSPYVFYPHYAWIIDFSTGHIEYADRTDGRQRAVILVRNL